VFWTNQYECESWAKSPTSNDWCPGTVTGWESNLEMLPYSGWTLAALQSIKLKPPGCVQVPEAEYAERRSKTAGRSPKQIEPNTKEA
jgi:hypothetical protein